MSVAPRRASLVTLALIGGLCALATPAAAQIATPVGSVDAHKERPLRFYGLGLDFSLYDSSGLNAVYYQNSLDYWFMPSWQLGQLALKGTRFENLTITGRFVLNSHLAGFDDASFDPNSNSGRLIPCSSPNPSANGTVDPGSINRCDYAPGDRRPTYSDVTLGMVVPRIWVIPVLDIAINPGISAVIPVSREARFTTLQTSLAAILGFNRAFFGGKLRLGYTLSASKPFYSSRTPQFVAGASSAPGGTVVNGELLSTLVGPNPSYFNNTTSATNVNWGMGHIFRADIAATDKLSFGVVYWLRENWKYDLDCNVEYNGTMVDACANGAAVAGKSGSGITVNPTTVSQIFSVSVGYQVTDYLSLSLALFTVTPQRAPDNSLRQPFLYWDANNFTQLSAGATFSLDHAAERLF